MMSPAIIYYSNPYSVGSWFKTSTDFGSNAFIVNKGGIGSDGSRQNMNYGIWLKSAESFKQPHTIKYVPKQFKTLISVNKDV